jgi:hypothetical protein
VSCPNQVISNGNKFETMINGVIRGSQSENIPSWKLFLREGDKICLGGGTSSETYGIDFTDQQWKDAAALKCGICIPIPTNISETKLYDILKRGIDFGANITDVRYFNEYANHPVLEGISLAQVPAHTHALVDAMITKASPLRTVVESLLTVTHIYSGIYDGPERYPNPETNKNLLYKREWMKHLDAVLLSGDAIDVHIYDRGGDNPQISEDNLREFFARFERPIYVIESGCIPVGAIPDKTRTYRTWDITHSCLGEKDDFGVQLAEQTQFGFGLVFNGELTHWGEKYLSLPRKTKPRVIKAWFSFGFGTFKWWIVKLSDGTERRIFSFTKPEVNSFL